MIFKTLRSTFFILLAMLYIGYTYYDYTVTLSVLIGLVLSVYTLFTSIYLLVKHDKDAVTASNNEIGFSSFIKVLFFLISLAYLVFTLLIYIPVFSIGLGMILAYAYLITNFITLIHTAYKRQKEQKKKKLNGGSPSFGR